MSKIFFLRAPASTLHQSLKTTVIKCGHHDSLFFGRTLQAKNSREFSTNFSAIADHNVEKKRQILSLEKYHYSSIRQISGYEGRARLNLNLRAHQEKGSNGKDKPYQSKMKTYLLALALMGAVTVQCKSIVTSEKDENSTMLKKEAKGKKCKYSFQRSCSVCRKNFEDIYFNCKNGGLQDVINHEGMPLTESHIQNVTFNVSGKTGEVDPKKLPIPGKSIPFSPQLLPLPKPDKAKKGDQELTLKFHPKDKHENDHEVQCIQLNTDDLEAAQKKSVDALRRLGINRALVGLSASVSIDGEVVWTYGLGFSNMETMASATGTTVYRVASISKPLSAVVAMELWQKGLLDLDAPVQKYVPDWPKKYVNGEEVAITTRHLLSHTSGIRHYSVKKPDNFHPETEHEKFANKEGHDYAAYFAEKKAKLASNLNMRPVKRKEKELQSLKNREWCELNEMYIDKQLTTDAAVKLFAQDELFFKPGTKFAYTTHGYTLVSKILESILKKEFSTIANSLFADLKLESTYLDVYHKIIKNRAASYERSSDGDLQNSPYIDLSYKWAGGGFLSSVIDLVKFGNQMLYAFETTEHKINCHKAIPGILNSTTVAEMWSPNLFIEPKKPLMNKTLHGYGLGWSLIVPNILKNAKETDNPVAEGQLIAYHTGGAIGGSSILMVCPRKAVSFRLDKIKTGLPDPEADGNNKDDCCDDSNRSGPHRCVIIEDHKECCECSKNPVKNELPIDNVSGVVVCIATNMTGISLYNEAKVVLEAFGNVRYEQCDD